MHQYISVTSNNQSKSLYWSITNIYKWVIFVADDADFQVLNLEPDAQKNVSVRRNESDKRQNIL